jgi:uncharacterized membrane protein
VKIKLLIGALVFLIVLNLATIGSFVYLQWSRGRDHASILVPAPEVSRRGREGRQFGRGMRLRKDERNELWRLLEDFRVETEALGNRVRDLERQSFGLMQRDPVPRDSLDILLEEISAIRLEISRRAIDKLIEASVNLTPGQRRYFYAAVLAAGDLRGPRYGKPGMGAPDRYRRQQGPNERRRQDAP